MTLTLIHGPRETALPPDRLDDAGLWLDPSDVQQATGWEWQEPGLCQADQCLPLTAAQRAGRVRAGRLNLTGFWSDAGQPVVHDDERRTWVLGSASLQRGQALATLQAPDFELPDLQGTPHRLRDWRGRKVLLATWASW